MNPLEIFHISYTMLLTIEFQIYSEHFALMTCQLLIDGSRENEKIKIIK